MSQMSNYLDSNFAGKEYWNIENQKYSKPHFRLRKIANVLNDISRGNYVDLLDIGCGPATLKTLLPENINYFGIDIALQASAPNLIELDIIKNEIKFGERRFDLIVASGVFEYLGGFQRQKLSEIHNILRENGHFILSYVNFDHFRKRVSPNYNNIQPIHMLKKDLDLLFYINRYFPTFHNRVCALPKRERIAEIQMKLYFNIPIFSPLFAVQYIFICSPKG